MLVTFYFTLACRRGNQNPVAGVAGSRRSRSGLVYLMRRTAGSFRISTESAPADRTGSPGGPDRRSVLLARSLDAAAKKPIFIPDANAGFRTHPLQPVAPAWPVRDPRRHC